MDLDDRALKSLTDDFAGNSTLVDDFVDNLQFLDGWKILDGTLYSRNNNAIKYVSDIHDMARIGTSSTNDYLQTWRNAFPNLQGGGFNVHHSIEQQVLNKWPDLFSESELHSIQNLRGISGEINPDIHLSRIRKEWDKFYDNYPPGGTIPTRQDVLDYATHIDNLLGNNFSPPVRK